MISRWQWLLNLLTRRLWFRAAMFGIGAIATALVATVAAPVVPRGISDAVSSGSVEKILDILASSMLAVATFSLGTMVAAFAAAASTATPRASKLLVEDPTSQNVLSTFVGAFIFSLVSIVALGTGYYGPGGRVILFGVTLLVILAVLVTFFRWIDYLSNLGRLSETVDKVENAAELAMRARWANPYLCCAPFRSLPSESFPLYCPDFGYIQHLDVAALSEVARAEEGRVYVNQLPGGFSEPTKPLLWTSWEPGKQEQAALLKAFLIGATRSFDQDPRFGLIVLSEIASRALSPGINDPGTAIDIIGRTVRVLSIWSQDHDAPEDSIQYPEVSVPRIEFDDLFADAFGPIARDGAGTIEVGIRLQKAFGTLFRISPDRFGVPARQHSDLALKLSLESLKLDRHRNILKDLAAEVGEVN